MKGFPDLPPLWLALFMALAWAMARFAPVAVVDAGLLRIAGIALACAGFAGIAWSAWWFWRKATTIEPHHKPGALIIEGPYRLSRNPIYLGMVMILAGQVLWQGALLPAVLLPVFIAILTTRFAKPEEQGLREAFGPEAEAYLSATRRWL